MKKKMTDKKGIDNSWVPREQIKAVLNREIVEPFLQSYGQDPEISLKLPNILALLRISEELIIEFDGNEVQHGKKAETTLEKNLYLGYLGKILQSSIVLVGATDYLGAMVLFRTIFELLIGISTTENGSMKLRILSIDFLDSEEKKSVYQLWTDLSAWAHPHGRWSKNICPKFYGIGRNYHPNLFQKCLKYADAVLDLMLTITVERFRIAPHSLMDKFIERFNTGSFLEISDLKMLKKRVESRTRG